MIINYYGLTSSLQKQKSSVYILCGQEPYLLNDAAVQIKHHYRQTNDVDEKILHLQQSADWTLFLDEANSYSLFSECLLLDVRFDKKNLDAAGKKAFNLYLSNINYRCIVVFRAPNATAKEFQSISSNDKVALLQTTPLNAQAMQKWIITQLQTKSLQYTSEVPELIQRYTQGNMLACAQAIERLALTHDVQSVLTIHDALQHLSDQCEFQLYELPEACLQGNAEKAIHLLRHAAQERIEPTLVLWLLTQEVRQLLLLSQLLKQSLNVSEACMKLKIWSSRINSYQNALKRLTQQQLYTLLEQCSHIDTAIKTGKNLLAWQALEQLSFLISA
jgi:DNA polymerase-3 subunit delta